MSSEIIPPAGDQSPGPDEAFLHHCLYFTTNRLSRAISRIADDAFATTGLAPAYGYLIRLVIGKPGITQKELAEKLYITPSTLTRFIDKLEGKRLVERQVQGKTVLVYPTDKAFELEQPLRQASKKLKETYEAILGKEAAALLTASVEDAGKQLE
ncbi:MarR family winged helix-turn-helix transcriptional regulator [Paenibacillus sp. MMS18-CY102]|uniref:MarR family winged helix-turn-helix transcriptional regulator n=1 Tax=Paenibacillus sp. MMS18-CY102 TaxID=2682849 RepID=UPI001365CF2B|nr:MarR family transcriptional regulator [Paenibacillus sp. MMS18-CY102]MWC29374.1 MarR family transcriptional regulator [Paenibacillus sp. MMS18-CY102]